MDDDRKKLNSASGEPSSAYSDAFYRQAPEKGRACYGYSPAQCYARASEEPAPEQEKPKKRGFLGGALVLLTVGVLMILTAGLAGSGSLFFGAEAGAVSEEPTREIYEDYSASVEAEPDGLSLRLAEGEPEELSPEDIYVRACRSTVGVTVPGYASNIFGQTGSFAVLGSGIVLSGDGYILTNYHVIESAYVKGAPILVMDYEGNDYEAEVVGVETDSDIAVLKIDAEGLEPAELGSASDIRVGQTIYAVGNPLGELTYTMTSGIVSALDRRITTDVDATVDMFQIDAAVNSGNSGGPVMNMYGQVIGVVTAKYTLDGMEGLGFAIPIDEAARIAGDLVDKGYVTGKAYLGLTLATVSPSVARYYDMVEGVYVYDVEEDSCAEKAGLTVGDIITAIDGQPVRTSRELTAAIRAYRAGESAELTIFRDEDYIAVTVVFDEALPAERMTDERAALDTSGELQLGEN